MLISFAVTAKLICVFVFAYADCWFSHEAAQIFRKYMLINFRIITDEMEKIVQQLFHFIRCTDFYSVVMEKLVVVEGLPPENYFARIKTIQ